MTNKATGNPARERLDYFGSPALHLYYAALARFGSRRGVREQKRSPPLIVSLTSFAPRIRTLHLCLESLLRQSLKPDYIFLWLSNELVRNQAALKKINKMQSRGLQIKFCDDIGAYKKIIPTLKSHPDAVIVTADDDAFYPEDFLHELFTAYLAEPQYIHCRRAHLMLSDAAGRLKPYADWRWFAHGVTRASLRLFPTGSGGVLYPPGALSPEVFNREVFMQLCPTGDDIWLKAMSLLNRVPCKKTASRSKPNVSIRGTQKSSLYPRNVLQGGNDAQIQAVFSHYALHALFANEDAADK